MVSSPVFFIANKGQFEPETEFLAFSQQMKARLEQDRIVLTQHDDRVEMMFPGARRSPRLEGVQRLATRVNYLRGGAAIHSGRSGICGRGLPRVL